MKTIGYNVYIATSGSDLSFLGFAGSLAEAKKLSRSGAGSLHASDWGTARATGHCDGLTAPQGTEDNDNIVWLHGDFCAVPVVADLMNN